jgi:hypothetical protein
MDMNEHILRGGLAKYLLNMGLQETTQENWGSLEPHMYVRGTEPIDGVVPARVRDHIDDTTLLPQRGRGSHNSSSRCQHHFSDRQTGVLSGTTPRKTIELNQRTGMDQILSIPGKANANASNG